MDEHATSPSHARRPGALMPARGTVSLFELVLLLAVRRAGRRPTCRRTCRTSSSRPSCGQGLRSPGTSPGGYAGLISFGHAAFFGIGAYTSTILGVEYGLTPWIGLWLGGLLAAAFAAVLDAGLRAPARPVLHPLDARRRRGGAHRRAQLGGADRRGRRPCDPADAERRQHGVRLEDAPMRSLMLGYLVARLCRSPRCSKARATGYLPVRGARRRGRRQRRGREPASGAHRRHVP